MVNRRNRQPVVVQHDDDDDDDLDDDEIEDHALDDEFGDEDDLAHLPPYVLPRVDKLRKLHENRDEIMEKYLLERVALEKKFEELLNPIYKERATIVAGDKDDEIEAEVKANGETNGEDEADNNNNSNNNNEPRVKGIPQFWATAMARVDAIGELITEEDVDCLEHLLDVQIITNDDGKGFTLEFHFAPNDYFTNQVLTKEYEVPNLFQSEEPILKNVKGTTINWKPNRCLTSRVVKKKQRGKGKNAGQVRTVEKKEEKDSFFKWFDPPKMPTQLDEIDEEEAERLEEIFDADFEIAESFRCEVIPKAILWFANLAEGAEEDALEEAILDGVDEQ